MREIKVEQSGIWHQFYKSKPRVGWHGALNQRNVAIAIKLSL
jgi:hypothetical protein